jgi:hypothetical protein
MAKRQGALLSFFVQQAFRRRYFICVNPRSSAVEVSRFDSLAVAQLGEDVSVAAFWVTPTAQYLSAEFR